MHQILSPFGKEQKKQNKIIENDLAFPLRTSEADQGTIFLFISRTLINSELKQVFKLFLRNKKKNLQLLSVINSTFF